MMSENGQESEWESKGVSERVNEIGRGEERRG